MKPLIQTAPTAGAGSINPRQVIAGAVRPGWSAAARVANLEAAHRRITRSDLRSLL